MWDVCMSSAVHRVDHSGTPIENQCFMKVICNRLDQERVVGFHVVSPHAGEITQGVAVAMRYG